MHNGIVRVVEAPPFAERQSVPGVLVGQNLAVVVEEVFNGGVVVSCAAMGLRGALLEPVGFPAMVAANSYLANPLSLIHDHAYTQIPHHAKELFNQFSKNSISRPNTEKTLTKVSHRKKQVRNGVAPYTRSSPALTSSPVDRWAVRSACVLVDPPRVPNCASASVGGRRAKLMACEKIVQRLEPLRLPPPVRIKRKKPQQVHPPPPVVSNTNSSVSRKISRSGVKLKLTPCASMSNSSQSSSPTDKDIKPIEHILNCKKKLTFQRAMSSSLSPSAPSSISPSYSLPHSSLFPTSSSSPVNSTDTVSMSSSPEVDETGSDSGKSLIDVESLSPVNKNNKRLYLKDFSIRLVSINGIIGKPVLK